MPRKKPRSTSTAKKIPAPILPYQPIDPRRYNPGIGLIGCGGITSQHLTAYKRAGYRVVALCDIDESKAQQRRKEFYPSAAVYSDARELLRRDDVEVVDVATHPKVRTGQVRQALLAGKHVLSQKPFVLDLNEGEKLVELAEKKRVKLAVNQNGRWAPHFSYIRLAVAKGLIGKVLGAHLAVHWSHDWIAGTAFDEIPHAILYDFAIHWFDMVRCIMGPNPRRVFASVAPAAGQKAKPPLLGQSLIEYDGAQATLIFDGFARFGRQDETYVAGTAGSLVNLGTSLLKQQVTLFTEKGYARPKLKGSWFPDGFHATMGELLCAIEEKRDPSNSGRNNLASLALCFAALKSADTGQPQIPGKVRRVPA